MAAGVALGDVTRGYRRVLIMAAVIGVIGLILAIVLGHYVAGVTLCVGIALGFINARLTLSAAVRFSGAENRSKRPVVFGSLRRLGVITAVALVLAYVYRPDGLATFAGLAIFHILLLGNASTQLFRELRGTKA